MKSIKAFIQSFLYPSRPAGDTYQVERETVQLTGGYRNSIDKIRKKYFDIDKNGSLLIRTIVDYRASAIAGGEISFSADENTLLDLELWAETEKMNDKSTSYAQLLEREGRLAVAIYRKPNGWGFRALPWHQYKYELIYDDFENIKGIKYKTDKGEHEILKPFLIYVQYTGQDEYSQESIAPPKIAYCLKDIEEIESEMERWANINHFFADPTPHIDTTDIGFFDKLVSILSGRRFETPEGGTNSEDASKDERQIRKWKIGRGLTTVNTKLQYVQAEMRGTDSLDRIIQVRCMRISAITGYPIFLLYPELMSNRATAEEIAADTNQATVIERRKNEELWTQIAKSWCILENIFTGSSYDPNTVYSTLPQTSAAQIKLLLSTQFPLVEKGVISMKTFRESIPLVNAGIEEERIAEESDGKMFQISNGLKEIA